MKKVLSLSWLLWAVGAYGASTVSDVTVNFDDNARMMTIGYTLAGDPAVVTVDILKDGASIGAAKFADVAGDVNGVVKPGARTISWRPERLWPEQKFDTACFTAKVSAWATNTPPPYLVVWITEEKGKVRYYASEDALPGGITDDVYRTKRLVMARIPAAGVTWRMGSGESEPGYNSVSEKQHYVTFTNDYYVGVFPMTQGQAKLAWGANLSLDTQGTAYPTVTLSYNSIRGVKGGSPNIDWPNTGSAVATNSLLGKLRAMTGLAFDIPTEAQWEYAARAGSAAAYPNNLDCLVYSGTDANLSLIGWYAANSGYQMRPVGQKLPNAWGLYDVCGTIWEWCRDWVDTSLQMSSADVTDPPGLASATNRSRRGGCYNNQPYAARCAFRTSNTPDTANGNISFRLCLHGAEVYGK